MNSLVYYSKPIKIIAYKYKEIPHYEWKAFILEKTENHIITLSKPNRKLKHYTKGETFQIPGYAIEYFSLKECYTASLLILEENREKYYCNIALPSRYDENVISFIDLDLDVITDEENQWLIIDQDEFKINSKKYSYPKEIVELAEKMSFEILEKARTSQYPFDGTLEKFKKYCKENAI